MNLASLIGIVSAAVVLIYAMVVGRDFSALKAFWDVPSVLIVFGGSFFSLLVSQNSIKHFLDNMKSFMLIFKPMNVNEEETIRSIIGLSNIARKEGLLALEEASNTVEDPFLKKGIMLIVDGTDPELVRSIMETELICIGTRHKSVMSFWDTLGALGPSWGMMGTFVGLINMLGELDDLASVGPNMAVALITSFYGSLLANWICGPVSNKLKLNDAAEIMSKEITVEGLLSIQAGENPRVIEEKLKSFLSPKRKEELSLTEGGDNNG